MPDPSPTPVETRDPVAAAADAAKEIIVGTAPGDAQTLVRHAEALGYYLKNNNLTTAQIRNIFGQVRAIESTWRQGGVARGHRDADERARIETTARDRALWNLTLLKPRLAYAAGRDRNVRPLELVLRPAIEAVLEPGQTPKESLRRFENFVNFFEAILAYHKAAGGK